MAEVQNLSVFGFSGLVTDRWAATLTPQESPSASNIEFGDRGEVIRRDGYTIFTTGGTASSEGRFLYHFRALDVANTILAYVDDSTGYLYFLDVGNSETALEPVLVSGGANAALSQYGTVNGYQKAAAVFNNYLYLSDNIRAIKVAGMAAGGAIPTAVQIADNTLNGSGAEFPYAKTLVSWNDRMVAGNVTINGSTKYATRLYFSDVADANTWQSTAWIAVGPDDGGEIRQILVYGDSLLVWKDNSFYAVTGNYPDLSIQVLHSGIGTTAGLTISQDQSNVFWFDPDQGVFLFDGGTVQRIDQSIHTELINVTSASHRSHGKVWNDRYYLSVPSVADGRPDITYVYHQATGSWSKWTLGWRSSVFYNGTVYACGLASTENGVAKLFQGALTDNGTDFSWSLETPWLPPVAERGVNKYRLHRLQTYLKGQTAAGAETATVSVVLRTDFDNTTAVRTISQSAESTDQAVIGDTAGLGVLCDVFKIAFSSDQQVASQLFGFTAVLSARAAEQGAVT